jgi:energy-coupling factor transport system ATP-binding protein
MILSAESDHTRGLDPDELAGAAVMSALVLGLIVLSSVVPQLGMLEFATVVPFGIVAERHRVRALVAALAAAAFIAVLVVGLGSAVGLGACALFGGVVGAFRRRGHGLGAVLLVAAVVAPPAAALADALLLVFASYRTLVLQSARSSIRGLVKILHHLGPLNTVATRVAHVALAVINHWAITVAGLVLIVIPVAFVISWWLLGRVLDRLRWVSGGEMARIAVSVAESGAEPRPLPVELSGVSVHHGEIAALSNLDLQIAAGQFIAVVGENGSGKSTLARLLAGAEPSAGTVARDGDVGLGRPGGTAVIGQRPDTQIVGLHVADDVVWGLPEEHGVDVEALLATVGLAGMGARDTASLSGGQLQRLAVAAALARGPRLLISDESTAMVDPAGRRELTRLFAELPRGRPMTVLHITHHDDELALADRVLRLERGRLVSDDAPLRPAGQMDRRTPVPSPARTRRPGAGAGGDLVLRGVGHDYGHGTVWEHRALEGISLTIPQGDGVLVVGENGSGKSTLAWIMAGLTRPTFGECLLAGERTFRRRGAVGLAFQHARLQLQRPTVAAEIADAAGWTTRGYALGQAQLDDLARERRVAEALRAVRLEPELAARSIEQLSGGQQRRLALAGLLARGPQVLVLDEPLAGLDAPAREALVALLAELRDRDGLTLIVVTHDPEALLAVCPRLLHLERGRLIGDGTAEEPEPIEETNAA